MAVLVLIVLLAGCGREGSGSGDAAGPPPPERLRITTSDGFGIVADLHRPTGTDPAPLVVMGHQLYRDRHSWDPLVPGLVAAGYAVVAVDHRGFGESTAEAASLDELTEENRSNLYFDLTETIDLVSERADIDGTRVVVMGSGISVDPAVRCARLDDDVRAIVMFPGYLAQSGRDYVVEHAELPVLMIAAREEISGRGLMRQYADRFTGPAQEYMEFDPTDVDDATWEGTDGLARDSGLVQIILWFLERNAPVHAAADAS
jgi:dienelactone hydrolase